MTSSPRGYTQKGKPMVKPKTCRVMIDWQHRLKDIVIPRREAYRMWRRGELWLDVSLWVFVPAGTDDRQRADNIEKVKRASVRKALRSVSV